MPDEPAGDPQQIETPEPTLDQRIAALTSTVGQQQDANTNQNTAVLEALGKIETLLSQQAQRPAPAAPSGLSPDQQALVGLFGSQTQQQGQVDTTPKAGYDNLAIGQLVNQAVQQAVAPIAQRLEAGDKAAQLRQQQEAYFTEAHRAHPGIADPQSPLGVTFEKLWNARADLRALPDGPRLAAEIANSLAGSIKVADKAVAERKEQATLPRPLGSQLRIGQPEPSKREARTQELLEKSHKDGGAQPLELSEFAQLTEGLLQQALSGDANKG